MDIKKISDLAKILKVNQLTKLDLTEGETRLVLEANAGKVVMQAEEPVFTQTYVEEVVETVVAQPVVAAAPKSEAFEQKAPLVGTVYLAAQVGAEPFVKVGDKVAKGDPVCIVESMKMFNTIEADEAGVIEEVCVHNGQIVEFGQVLVRIAKEA